MQSNFHIKGLDGLRAIAALSVLIGHIELIKEDSGLKNFFLQIENWGRLGVNLFFVLSGFLITTLLIRQKISQGTINLKKFYIRRILRIWPLYFLILILTILIFNFSSNWLTIVLCFSIFPNIAHALSIGWIYSPIIWSIGVEEQFYLFWPSILKNNNKTVIIICLFFILIYPFSPHLIQFILIKFDSPMESLLIVEKLFDVLNFNAMATGALASIMYYSKTKVLFTLLNVSKLLNNFLIVLPLVLWLGDINFSFLQMPIYSILFGFMILAIANGSCNFFFESNTLKFLGKISFGIYMYHWIIILLYLKLFKPFFHDSYYLANILLYLSVISTTIIVAFLSFYLYENKFLKLKVLFN